MATKKTLSEEDISEFRRAMAAVDRLDHDKIAPAPRRPKPVPVQTQRNEQDALRESLYGGPDPAEAETGEELLYLRPGVQRKIMRKLRRGQFSIGGELDLHGLTVSQARESLIEFLKDCRLRDIRCVRIIHGKGLRSPNGRPVIKGKLDQWLRLRDEVVAYSSARPIDGGTGAVYVLLKRG